MKRMFPQLLVLPFFLLFLAFFVAPGLFALHKSLYAEPLVGGRRFVGLENYQRALSDESLGMGLVNIASVGAIYLCALLVFATTVAILLDYRPSRFYRLVIFVPYAVPSAVAALMWGYLYGRQFGPFKALADFFGTTPFDFFSPDVIAASLANVVMWQFLGYNMLILYVALSGISRELYEAAGVDGANQWRIAWHIKLPLLRPALGLIIFFSFIGSLQLFNEPFIFKTIAPDVVGRDFTPNLYAYTVAFSFQELPYSAAVSFVLAGIAIIGAIGFLFFSTGRRVS